MKFVQFSGRPEIFISEATSPKSSRQRGLRSQVSRLAILSAIGFAATTGASLMTPEQALAACAVGATTVTCGPTTTTDTVFPANAPVDRDYVALLGVPVVLTVNPAATVDGFGLAVSNIGAGGVTVTNGGTISVNLSNTPTAGGTAALSVAAAGGPIVYTGGGITNNGSGNAFDATQTAGVGSININITGAVTAATYHLKDTIPTLLPGASGTFTFRRTIK